MRPEKTYKEILNCYVFFKKIIKILLLGLWNRLLDGIHFSLLRLQTTAKRPFTENKHKILKGENETD